MLLKGWSGTKNFYSYILFIYPISALLSPLPLIPFTTEEITGCTNEVAEGIEKAGRILPPCFFI